MKVLILPNNIASEISHKVRALRNLGVEARGLAVSSSVVQTGDEVKIISSGKRDYLRDVRAAYYFYKWIEWADIVHWIWSFDAVGFGIAPFKLRKIDKRIVKMFDKPGVVQWCGSDIRDPETDCRINPFYRRAFENGYEYAGFESRANSVKNQKDFAEVGFYPLEFIGMEHYIDRELFPKRFRIWQTVALSEHEPKFPSAENRRPLVVHSPTAPVAKGTKYVLEAVERLKTRYDFDFRLVQNTERREALEVMRECDIFIDQIILGAHGVAAVEAMAFGKPVICYINEQIGRNYPPELPIINADPETIGEKLELLLKDPALRRETGLKGREYAEKYHDETKIARSLVEIYREVIELHGRKAAEKNG